MFDRLYDPSNKQAKISHRTFPKSLNTLGKNDKFCKDLRFIALEG